MFRWSANRLAGVPLLPASRNITRALTRAMFRRSANRPDGVPLPVP